MNTLTLDGLRLAGSRLIALLTAALALPVVGRAIFSPTIDAFAAAALAVLLPVLPLRSALSGKTGASERIMLGATVSAMPALLLFAFRGFAWQVDIHMIFFAALAAVAILADWRAIVAGAAVVAVHHLVFGLTVPAWVFGTGGSLPRILFHAVVLIVEAGALIWLGLRLVALLDAVEAEQARRIAAQHAASAERAAESDRLAQVVEQLGEGLAALGAGDLTRRLSGRFPDAYARLAAEYEAARQALAALVSSVTTRAASIGGGVHEIAQASEDLARRTESNAASIEQTSAALVEIDGRTKATAAAAERTVGRADQTIATVSGGRAVADEAVGAMRRVSESATGIDDVIEGLDKIAFQTRVLAMNAAVEAGRAGEAGRGFAVVADLVSALAMRAEEEAKRAREQLTVTQTEIGSAVEAVQKVDGALQAISAEVGEVHQLLGGIAGDNLAQASAISQIGSAIAAMDRSTQQNAAMVEQVSAAATQLGNEASALTESADAFRSDSAPSEAGAFAGPVRKLPAAAIAALTPPRG
jgi:methyl-accepting chemotaxis protein